MVNAGRAVQAAQLGHALRVVHAGQQGRELGLDHALVCEGLQLLVDAVEREFTVIDQQQLCGTQLRQLAAQLAANAAARTGDQHHLACDVMLHQGQVGGDGRTPQQVFNVQVLKVGHRHLAAGQVGQAGQGADAHGQGAQAFDDLLAPLAGHAGQGQQHVGNAQALHGGGQGVGCVHAHAVDAATHFAGVVVGKGQQVVAARADQPRSGLRPGCARAVNQQPVGGCRGAPRQPQPAQRAAGAHQQQKNHRLQNAHAARNPLPLADEQGEQQDCAVDGHGLAGGEQGLDACVAEDGAVQPQVHQDGKRQCWGQGVGNPLLALRPVQGVQPQGEGHPHGKQAHACVQRGHKQALGGSSPSKKTC